MPPKKKHTLSVAPKNKGTHKANDMFIVQEVKAQRFEKGVPVYLVKWRGHNDETWEPMENLAGAEMHVSTFINNRDKQNAELAEKRLEQLKTRAQAEAAEVVEAEDVKEQHPSKKRKTSWVWQAFDPIDKTSARCTVVENGKTCGQVIQCGGGTTNLQHHVTSKHKNWYVAKFQKAELGTLVVAQSGDVSLGSVPPWNAQKRKLVDRKCAYWIVKCHRALGICDSDEPLRDLFREISSGRYSGTNHHEIAAQILQMVAVGGVHLNNVLIKTVADEIFPAMAADLWSDGEVALLGVMLYWIDEEFVYHETLVGAIPFSNKRHTGDNILKATKECLQKYGCPWDRIIARVSDSGSNMKKAMASLDGFSCSAHALELGVHKFTEAPHMKATVDKTKARVWSICSVARR